MPINSNANCECYKVSTTNNVREAMEMAKRPSPRTQDTIVAMCEDGRRRSSVFLSSTIPERTTRQVVGREPHFSVSQIGDIHLFGGRSAH